MKKTLIVGIFVVIVVGIGSYLLFYQKNAKPTDADLTLDDIEAFPAGIYYRMPTTEDPTGTLSLLNDEPPFSLRMQPVDFDIRRQRGIYVDGDTLVLISSNRQTERKKINGLYAMARPALSHNGLLAAVQATETPLAEGQAPNPATLGIFIIDLADGTVTARLNGLGVPAESPAWFNTSPKLAYSTFSATEGVDIHVVNVETLEEVLTIQDAGWLHLAISQDDTELLVPATMKIYDLANGSLIDDLKDESVAALSGTEYRRDTIHPGDLDNFPLDGDFSPDGKTIVFDGAVLDSNRTGMVIGTIQRDGTGARIISDFIPINPEFSNNNNFSQLNPVWL